MNLKQYIEELQKLYNEHGDLEIIYAADDEGNGYEKVHYNPSIMFFDENSKSGLSLEDKESDQDEFSVEKFVKVICIN